MTKIKAFFLALFTTFFFAAPAWAVDVQMGANGNLVFEPAEVSIAAGESVHFINNMLPPHNVVIEDHPEWSHEALAMLPGEDFEVAFPEPGDYTYWCGPHKGAGMIGSRTRILMNHADHSTFEHIIHMLLCCIAGLGIGTLAVWGYNKIRENKNHNP